MHRAPIDDHPDRALQDRQRPINGGPLVCTPFGADRLECTSYASSFFVSTFEGRADSDYLALTGTLYQSGSDTGVADLLPEATIPIP